tara:strand:+ start:221 stop:1453 length:1233 start_codon:yes stop_codon:yes gene_type:complete
MGDGGLGAYKEMFKFCLTAGSHGSAPGGRESSEAEPLRPLEAEEREWLTNAMQSFVVDVGKRLKDLVIVLRFTVAEGADGAATKVPSGSSPGTGMAEVGAKESIVTVLRRIASVDELRAVQQRAMEEVEDVTDQIDYAIDFCDMGGLAATVAIVRDAAMPPALRAAGGRVLAQVLQNNPRTQAMAMATPAAGAVGADEEARAAAKAAAPPRDGALGEPLLATLLALCADGGIDAKVRLAVVGALSALVRGTDGDYAADVFLSGGGGVTVAALLALEGEASNRTVMRLQRKTLFLVHFLLCSSDSDAVVARVRGALQEAPPAAVAPRAALQSAAILTSSADPDVQEWAVRVLSAAVVGDAAAVATLPATLQASAAAGARAYITSLKAMYADELEMVDEQMREAIALVAALR